MTEPLFGPAELGMELRQILTGAVPELHAFEVVPDSFIGVELRGIGGEALQLEPLGRASGQVLLDVID